MRLGRLGERERERGVHVIGRHLMRRLANGTSLCLGDAWMCMARRGPSAFLLQRETMCPREAAAAD